MKISSKLILSIFFILGFSLLSCFVVINISNNFNHLNIESTEIDNIIVGLTDFRAASRQITVEAYQSLYFSDGKNKIQFEKAIDLANAKWNKFLEVNKKKSAQAISLNLHFKELIIRLHHVLDMQSSGQVAKAHGYMKDTVEIFFKKVFLEDLGLMLSSVKSHNEVVVASFDNSAKNLSRFIVFSLTLLTLIIAIILIPIAFSLKNRSQIILNNLNNIDFNKNVFPILSINGHDEFSVISTCFNELSLKLKESKIQIEVQQKNLVDSSRLASLGEISAGIAHEINNPLTIISGSVNLITKVSNDPEKLSKKIESIVKSCNRIAKIVNGLKKFSRSAEQVPFTQYSLYEIVAESVVLTAIKSKMEDTPITVECLVDHNIFCNEMEIEQVIINLVNNAIDAVKGTTNRWVKVTISEEEKFVILRVSDSGAGIPQEIQDKLFNPFFTTKVVGEGTGLGLSITKGILDEHQATISIVPNISHTCFEIKFKKVEEILAA